MTRTNIEIDDVLVDRVMRLYRLRSKREAVDLALRKLVGERMSGDEMLEAEGRDWGGDLDEIRLSPRCRGSRMVAQAPLQPALPLRRWPRRLRERRRAVSALPQAGEAPRQLSDRLIAAVAIRNDTKLLCEGADFHAIARHAPLRLVGM
jgi:Arc/MetJ family transcription regulator